MAINENWKITSRSHSCAHTGAAFTDGETFYTALFEDPGSGELQRRDYSMQSWGQVKKEINPFSFWKSVYEAPRSEAKQEPIEREGAEDLLRRLIEEDNIGTENTRYILAVMLERKRVLKQTGTRDTDDATFLIYENPKSGEVLFIRDPELRLDQVEAVQREVVLMLGYGPKGDANQPAEAVAAAEASGADQPAPADDTADSGLGAAEPQAGTDGVAEIDSAAGDGDGSSVDPETDGTESGASDEAQETSGDSTSGEAGDEESSLAQSGEAEPPSDGIPSADEGEEGKGDGAVEADSAPVVRKKSAPRARREKKAVQKDEDENENEEEEEAAAADEPAEESIWIPDLGDSQEEMEEDAEAPLFQAAHPDTDSADGDPGEPEKPAAG